MKKLAKKINPESDFHVEKIRKKIINPKNKRLFRHFYWSTTKNRLFVILFSLFIVMPIIANLVIQIFVNNSILPNVEANSYMVYIGVVQFLSLMFVSMLSTFTLFVSSKNNGSLLYLYTLDYDRNFLYKVRILLVTFITFLSSSIVFVFNIIVGSSFGNMSSLFFFATYVASIVILLFISVIFAGYSYFLKSVSFIVVSTITIISSMVLFFLGSSYVNNSSNKLEFNQAINQNNYSKLLLTDENGNEKGNYIIVNKKFDNTINASSNLEDAFQGLDNKVFMNFSLLNIFTQASSNIQDGLGGKRTYTQQELHKISNNGYSHNYNLFSLKNYKTGDPDQIKDSTLGKIFISYQDENPFNMTYNEIYERISKLIIEKGLVKNQLLIDSIMAKTSNEDYWSNQNSHLSDQELSILKDYSGVEENQWLFYIHNYYPYIKNKLAKLKDDLSTEFGDKIGEFIWYIFDGEKYNNNLIKFNSIQPREKILNRFPMIGAMDENDDADLTDVMYFKKDLIHSVGDGNSTVFKIQEKNGGGYSLIDLKQVDNSIVTIKDWDNYIDNNLEIVNLRKIYKKLFSIDNNIDPKYEFNNNVDDIYQINRVMNIEQVPWINNVWIHILVIFLLTTGIYYYSNKMLYKREGKDVE